MYVVCVTIRVKPEYIEPFKAASRDNHENTRKEPGNLRFDVLQGEDDPTRFFLYEVYRKKEDFASHHKTEHYARWRDTVNPWMAEPRVGVKHFSLFPADENFQA
ncbi:MAG TPA: antibiotic biosynthesis monooxygenase [Planctomycetota bacterium]|nr:antibiotic biosynthesis monooxygenase [Planctomycetota bacterium]